MAPHHRPSSSVLRDQVEGNGAPQARLVRCLAREAMQSTATIGRDGGTLTVGRNQLLIPAGALQRTVTITARVVADTIAGIEFAPEGLRFKDAATLTISAHGCPVLGKSPHVAYFEDAYEILDQLPAKYDAGRVVVTAKISHFSGYAIAW